MTAAPPQHANTVLEAAHVYISNGISVVPVPHKAKKPVLDGWQNLRLTADDLPAHFRGDANIGILDGEPSGNLIDNDLDVPEAIQAAAVFMPPTGRIHGRKGKRRSHRWYRVPDGIKSKKFQYPEAGKDGNIVRTAYLELRSTGGHTLVPPSLHPTGEQYEWEREDKPATVDANVLLAAAGKTAACALLARHWPGTGSRDDCAMALSGMLLRGGWSETDTAEFVVAVAEIAGDEQWRDRDKAKRTAAKLAAGENVTGGLRLVELLRDGERVVSKAREWLGIRDKPQENQDLTWDEPTPLPDTLPPVEPFAIKMLPNALRGWVWDVTQRMQCPPDFAAVAVLVALATVVGRQVGIHPKRYDDWLVTPNLWGAVVGPPSSKKSPALEAGLKPLARLEAEAAQEHAEAVRKFDRENLMYTARKSANATAMKKAADTGDEAELQKLAADAPQAPVVPVERRYSTNDATIEKLGELLLGNPNGMLQFRDELVGWLRRLDAAGHEADRAFFLEAFNGNNAHKVDRIGRGSLYIPALCLSLLGGIQPGPLASYVYDASNAGSAGNDGLLQRFQLLVWPDPPKTWKNVDRYPDTDAKNIAYAVFKRLSVLDVATLAAMGAKIATDADGNPEPGAIPSVRFTEAAQALFDGWQEELELRLRAGEMAAPLEAHLAKYPSLFPSLGLLFHLVDGTPDDAAADDQGGVSAAAAMRAGLWCAYLESHARRLYAHAENPGLERASALLEHIRAGDVPDGTVIYHIVRHHWARLTTPDELDEAIKTLESYGWVQIQSERPQGGIGRPSPRLRLHPSLLPATSAERQVA